MSTIPDTWPSVCIAESRVLEITKNNLFYDVPASNSLQSFDRLNDPIAPYN